MNSGDIKKEGAEMLLGPTRTWVGSGLVQQVHCMTRRRRFLPRLDVFSANTRNVSPPRISRVRKPVFSYLYLRLTLILSSFRAKDKSELGFSPAWQIWKRGGEDQKKRARAERESSLFSFHGLYFLLSSRNLICKAGVLALRKQIIFGTCGMQ